MMLLLFDIDGTLIRGGRSGRRALGLAFDQIFPSIDSTAAMELVEFNGRTDPQITRDVARAAGISEGELADSWELLKQAYLRHLEVLVEAPNSARPCPGIPELLEHLAGRPGLQLGLLTGNIESGARIKLGPFNMNRYFPEGGFGSDAEERVAIAAAARAKFEARLGRKLVPTDVVVIGDTVHDVACGRENGFRTVAVGTGGVPEERLRAAAADLYFADFGHLPDVLGALAEGLDIPV